MDTRQYAIQQTHFNYRALGLTASFMKTLTGVFCLANGKLIPGSTLVSAGITSGVYAYNTTKKVFDGIEYLKKSVVGGLTGGITSTFSWIGNGVAVAFGGGAAGKITSEVAEAVLHGKKIPEPTELLKSGAVGGFTGAVSFGATSAASDAANNIVKNLINETDEVATALARTAAGATSGAATAAISKIATNICEGKPATKDIDESAIVGATIGGAIVAAQHVTKAIAVGDIQPERRVGSRNKTKEKIMQHAPDNIKDLSQVNNPALSYYDKMSLISNWFNQWSAPYVTYLVHGKPVSVEQAIHTFANGGTVTVKLRSGLDTGAYTREITVHGHKLVPPAATNIPLTVKAPAATDAATIATPVKADTITTANTENIRISHDHQPSVTPDITPPITKTTQPTVITLLPNTIVKNPTPMMKLPQDFKAPPEQPAQVIQQKPATVPDSTKRKRFNPFEYIYTEKTPDVIERMLAGYAEEYKFRNRTFTDANIKEYVTFWFNTIQKDYDFEMYDVVSTDPDFDPFISTDEAVELYLQGGKIKVRAWACATRDIYVQGPKRNLLTAANVVIPAIPAPAVNPVAPPAVALRVVVVPQPPQAPIPAINPVAPPAVVIPGVVAPQQPHTPIAAINPVAGPAIPPHIAAKVASHSHTMYKLIQEDKISASSYPEAIKRFFQLELAIQEHSLTHRTKSGLFARPFAELAHIMKEIKSETTTVALGLKRLKKVILTLGSKHPLLTVINKCTPFQYQDQQYKDASRAMKL